MQQNSTSKNSTITSLVEAADQIQDLSARFRLDGRRFVVLGGGRGMGRHAVHSLAQLGAEVVVVDNEQGRVDAVVAEVGDAARGSVTDVTSDSQMAELAAGVGVIDGVIDVIGLARYGSLLEVSDETWSWEHDVVLRHAWLAVRHFGPLLVARKEGSLTFVSSVSGISSSPQHGAYGVFKAALISLVRTAAVELGGAGVRVNAVAPGFVLTPRIGEVLDDAQLQQAVRVGTLPWVSEPRDIAAALTFLASGLARTITGQTLVIDAGATTAYPYQMDSFSSKATDE